MSKIVNLNLISEQIKQCKECVLCNTEGEYVPGNGNPNAKILFLGEGPGANEAK